MLKTLEIVWIVATEQHGWLRGAKLLDLTQCLDCRLWVHGDAIGDALLHARLHVRSIPRDEVRDPTGSISDNDTLVALDVARRGNESNRSIGDEMMRFLKGSNWSIAEFDKLRLEPGRPVLGQVALNHTLDTLGDVVVLSRDKNGRSREVMQATGMIAMHVSDDHSVNVCGRIDAEIEQFCADFFVGGDLDLYLRFHKTYKNQEEAIWKEHELI